MSVTARRFATPLLGQQCDQQIADVMRQAN